MRGFAGYHPVIEFAYYILVVVLAMFSMHPVIVISSIFGAFLFFGTLYGMREMLSELCFFFLLFLMMSIINPLFVHNGETILFFMNDNPVTLEAIFYGGMSSLMLVSVLLWCRCYSEILTTDKFLYLFGKIIPKLGLIFSMTFRLIPLFQNQIRKIRQAQQTMGLYAGGSIPDRLLGSVRVFDSLVSWSMENSIDTADAMKARGYGLKGRTNFSLFRFQRRDGVLLAILIFLAGLSIFWFGTGAFNFYYYPLVAEIKTDRIALLQYGVLLVFFCIPGIIEIKEKVTWNCLKSKI